MAQSDLFVLQEMLAGAILPVAGFYGIRRLFKRFGAPPGVGGLLGGFLTLYLLALLAIVGPPEKSSAAVLCGLAMTTAVLGTRLLLSAVWFLQGVYHFKKDDRGRALPAFGQTLKYLPELVSAHQFRGLIYQAQLQYARAAHEFNRAIEVWLAQGNPYRPEKEWNEKSYTLPVAYCQRALNSYYRNKPDEAVHDWERALELEPRLAAAGTYAANLRYSMGDYNRVVEHITLVLETEPESADAYNTRAAALYRLGRHEEAIEDCNRALELKGGFEPALLNRSVSYLRFGDTEKAIEDCREALRLNPKSAALGILGLANSVKGKREGRIQWVSHLAHSYRFGKDLKPIYPVVHLMPFQRLMRLTQPSVN